MEVWSKIDNSVDYFVSNYGNVKRRNKLLKQFFNDRKYLCVGIKINGVLKTLRVHRLVALAFIPNPENKSQVNHKDLNKINNQFSNLEWNTPRENILHYHRLKSVILPELPFKNKTQKTSFNGENHHKSKLTESQVLKIRSQRGLKSNISIAKEFGISDVAVSHIMNRKSWQHI